MDSAHSICYKVNFFLSHLSTHFCKIIKESNFGLFQAPGIFHVLPKIIFRLFQSIGGVDPSEPLSFVGELHRFSPTRPHWAELVSKSPCPCVCMSVCMSVPSRNTHFRRSCRPLVEDRVPNIGLG